MVTGLFVVGLLVSGFVLPVGYSYSEPCLTCQSKGTMLCQECNGSGKCWVCDGTGEIWYMPEDNNWCAACSGTGVCYKCNGVGSVACGACGGSGVLTHWFFTLAGSAVVLSVVNVLLFLGLFGLSYVGSAFHLGFNQWVYGVEDMGFWFNPSFMTWLFAKHRSRWARWQTGLNFILAVYLGGLLFWAATIGKISSEFLQTGFLLGLGLVLVFALLFYKSYTSRLRDQTQLQA